MVVEEDSTSEFLRKNYEGLVYYPFDYPKWWFKTKESDYVWHSTDLEKTFSPEMLPFDIFSSLTKKQT